MVGEIAIDHAKGELQFAGKTFHFAALSPTAQELVIAGGAEAVVAKRLQEKS
jgi:hypothetical protein